MCPGGAMMLIGLRLMALENHLRELRGRSIQEGRGIPFKVTVEEGHRVSVDDTMSVLRVDWSGQTQHPIKW